jgi:hypothetical protein
VLFSLPRDGYTNQRLKFSLDSSGKYIGTGDIHGNFSSFDLETGEEMFSQKLYNDVCSSVDFHPFLPLMASTSGERRDHEEDSNQKSGKKVGGVAVWRMGEN